MKVHTGLMELIFVMVMMLASVTLLNILVISCRNGSKMNYIKDKTVVKLSDSVEWEEKIDANGKTVLIPKMMAPINVDYGGAQIIALINDDYCPEDGRTIYYDYDAVSVYSAFTGNEGLLKIVDGWKMLYTTSWSTQLDNSLGTDRGDKCLVWNAKEHCWMITNSNINIFE